MIDSNDQTSTDIKPEVEPEAWFSQALAYMRIEQWAEAEKALRQALQLAPNYAEAHCNLGYVLEQCGHWDAAENAYRSSFQQAPALLNAALNLGVLLQRMSRFDEAESIYQQAMRHHSEQPALWTNLGILYTALQREHEAERAHRHALNIAPDYRKARFNLSYLLLRQGRFEEGWRCLEARTLTPHASIVNAPRWNGEPLSGKTLLIICEGGHGDAIQFCRYALMLQQQWSVRLQIVCPLALQRLFSMQPMFDEILTNAGQAQCDYWCPLLSLPGLMETRIDNIPAQTPYLSVSSEHQQEWQALLPAEGVNVGLVWKGNPKFENDVDRSLPSVGCFMLLRNIPGVNLIRLQQEPASEVGAAAVGLHDLPEAMVDFADMAAVISGLDLVISVDTAAAHLAGAMGKPCWLMLPTYMTDWRWMTVRDDSPWYPSMRLFRQTERGMWLDVMNDMAHTLQAATAVGGMFSLRE